MARSPYDPPGDTEPQTARPNPAVVDTVFFTVNATFALLCFAVCVSSTAAADDPSSFIGGAFAVLPVGCYVVAERDLLVSQENMVKTTTRNVELATRGVFSFRARDQHRQGGDGARAN